MLQVCQEPQSPARPQGIRLNSGANSPRTPQAVVQATAGREDPPLADHWDSSCRHSRTPSASSYRAIGTRHALSALSALMPSGTGPVLSLAGRWTCAIRRDDSAPATVAHTGGRFSGGLAGPSSRHACWRVRVRQAHPAQAHQALIKRSLGLLKSVLP